MSVDVALVTLGRASALGESRRVESWQEVIEACGASVATVELMTCAPARPWAPPGLGAILARRAVPETALWSIARARRAIVETGARRVVFVTSRSFHPSLVAGFDRSVLDLVDQLSRSYDDRAALSATMIRRAGLQLLAASQRRAEQRGGADATVAAGWEDARALGATWMPNVVAPVDITVPQVDPDHDLLFVGSLSYAPNVDALDRLAAIWPAVREVRADITLLVAGARPNAHARDLCARRGWTLVPDYVSATEIYARARIAVNALRVASGIQNKVLDAAAHGVAQICSPVALRGLAPGFPGQPVESDEELVQAICTLAGDESMRSQLAAEQRSAARAYAPGAWSETAARLLHLS